MKCSDKLLAWRRRNLCWGCHGLEMDHHLWPRREHGSASQDDCPRVHYRHSCRHGCRITQVGGIMLEQIIPVTLLASHLSTSISSSKQPQAIRGPALVPVYHLLTRTAHTDHLFAWCLSSPGRTGCHGLRVPSTSISKISTAFSWPRTDSSSGSGSSF